jgi:hypothetical protein
MAQQENNATHHYCGSCQRWVHSGTWLVHRAILVSLVGPTWAQGIGAEELAAPISVSVARMSEVFPLTFPQDGECLNVEISKLHV